ncbi:MAG: pyruvate carboxylase subunit B [Candidatus Alcyoniella australis]|nr:pyruvate carboxylase subunit B [Candidatus Alcyoniella australis]
MSNGEQKSVGSHRLKITDTTLRDGHQSSMATRLRWEDIEMVAEAIDSAGFHSVEVWGGATFDVLHRFLGEDPWERARRLKKLMPKTPFQMLLRGQNLVGYRNYADDVVDAFVDAAANVGIEIFRVFDALNDPRNLQTAAKAIARNKMHFQAAISYALTERRIGGPVFNMDYYVNKARQFAELGADSLCIKDMAGLLNPDDAFKLVSRLKSEVSIPIQMHTHFTSGMADMAYLRACEAGADIIDCALAPLALRSSQPAVEPFVVTFMGTERDTGLDLELLGRIGEQIERFAPKYRDFIDRSRMAVIDIGVLLHQIPGGMQSNMINQLKAADALDRLHEVHEELPRVRRELGFPPLVTPTSQIVGVQSVMNVLSGRYQIVSSEVKDLCYGLYGATPAAMDPEVRARCLQGYERGEQPIDCRPADILEPELEQARKDVAQISDKLEDVLTYALYPRTGMIFLRYKYGLDNKRPGEIGKTIEQAKAEDELAEKARHGELMPRPTYDNLPPDARRFGVMVDGEYLEVAVSGGEALGQDAIGPAPGIPTSAAPRAAAPAASAAPAAPASVGEGERAVSAPMPGTVIKIEVETGAQVKSGQTLLVLEAMKMENALVAPCDGTIKRVACSEGQQVRKDAVLLVLG